MGDTHNHEANEAKDAQRVMELLDELQVSSDEANSLLIAAASPLSPEESDLHQWLQQNTPTGGSQALSMARIRALLELKRAQQEAPSEGTPDDR